MVLGWLRRGQSLVWWRSDELLYCGSNHYARLAQVRSRLRWQPQVISCIVIRNLDRFARVFVWLKPFWFKALPHLSTTTSGYQLHHGFFSLCLGRSGVPTSPTPQVWMHDPTPKQFHWNLIANMNKCKQLWKFFVGCQIISNFFTEPMFILFYRRRV